MRATSDAQTMSKLIEDELTQRSASRQQKYQSRTQRRGARGRTRRCEDRSGRAVQPRVNGERRATRHARPAPVHFAYHAEGVAVTASMMEHGGLTRFSLAALLQTFLTSLTWLCPINCSSTEGWLTLTLADKQSLWKVTRSASDSSSLRLIPVSGEMSALVRSATECFGASNRVARHILPCESVSLM
jgi:hypothetical protein